MILREQMKSKGVEGKQFYQVRLYASEASETRSLGLQKLGLRSNAFRSGAFRSYMYSHQKSKSDKQRSSTKAFGRSQKWTKWVLGCQHQQVQWYRQRTTTIFQTHTLWNVLQQWPYLSLTILLCKESIQTTFIWGLTQIKQQIKGGWSSNLQQLSTTLKRLDFEEGSSNVSFHSHSL